MKIEFAIAIYPKPNSENPSLNSDLMDQFMGQAFDALYKLELSSPDQTYYADLLASCLIRGKTFLYHSEGGWDPEWVITKYFIGLTVIASQLGLGHECVIIPCEEFDETKILHVEKTIGVYL
jgi:hypothetical protein